MTPAALETLVRLARHDKPEGPLPPPFGEAWEALLAEGLIDATGDLTPRGAAYLDMILATPLPVQSWIDPRATGEVVYPMKQVAFNQQTAQFETKTTYRTEMPAVQIKPPPLPEGFTPVTRPGGIPSGLDGKQWIAVQRRSGKVQTMFAVQVNWAHTGGPDDPVAWQVAAEPQEHFERHVGGKAGKK